MKIVKYVDIESQEVQIEIAVSDVREAMDEAFKSAVRNAYKENNKNDVLIAINDIGIFLKALTDRQIEMLNFKQRETIGEFLEKQGKRFKVTPELELLAKKMQK